MDSKTDSESSSGASDLRDLERDLPTTEEDLRALRENRPRPGEDWLEELRVLSELVGPEVLRRRPTSEGVPPFEL